jgi:hypothetical protein
MSMLPFMLPLWAGICLDFYLVADLVLVSEQRSRRWDGSGGSREAIPARYCDGISKCHGSNYYEHGDQLKAKESRT